MGLEFDNEDEGLEFDVLTEFEKENLVSKLSDEVIKSSIKEQINTPILNDIFPNNILNVFSDRFMFIKKFYPNNDSLVDSCNNARIILYKFILNEISEKFNFTTDLEEYTEEEDFFYSVEALYNFFVVNYRENLENFIIKHIKESSKDLIKNFKSETNRKDLIYKSLKKVFGDSENIHIIYNLESIVKSIAESFSNGEDIIKTITYLDPYEFNRSFIKDLFLENKYDTYVDSGFSEQFLSPLKNDEYNHEIINSIKYKLMSYYNTLEKTNKEKEE